MELRRHRRRMQRRCNELQSQIEAESKDIQKALHHLKVPTDKHKLDQALAQALEKIRNENLDLVTQIEEQKHLSALDKATQDAEVEGSFTLPCP